MKRCFAIQSRRERERSKVREKPSQLDQSTSTMGDLMPFDAIQVSLAYGSGNFWCIMQFFRYRLG